MLELDPVLLARIQFAFTVSFHIIFPAFTIGLASFLAVIEWRWLKTGSVVYKNIYKFWVKIFAVAFGMGVVSGVTMSYQFGTNWSVFSDRISNVIGPLLGYEVLTAFFLEASFLGIMLFGFGRVSKKMHFFATCIVAGGTFVSAFWILAANSWMQTPAGFEIGDNNILFPTNWLEIIFNPSFPYRLFHMILAAYLSTAFVIGGVACYYLIKKKYIKESKIMLGMATIMAILVAPMQLFIGHMHGENTMKYQPQKVAAIEGNWDHRESAPLHLFAIPDQKLQKNLYEISIKGGASLVLTGDVNGKIPALLDFPKDEIPPVAIVFWSFRIMVAIGLLMILVGLLSSIQYLRGKLFDSKLLHRFWLWMLPSGFIALLAGWFVTEVGRQPWSVFGVIKTANSVSPAILGGQVAWSLLAFVIIYSLVFGAGMYYMVKLVKMGIKSTDDQEQFYKHGIEASLIESKAPVKFD